MALITDPNSLRFENIYVYFKPLNQPKYVLMKKLLESVEGVGFSAFQDYEQVVASDEARPRSVIILVT